jgi:hypothetical protein
MTTLNEQLSAHQNLLNALQQVHNLAKTIPIIFEHIPKIQGTVAFIELVTPEIMKSFENLKAQLKSEQDTQPTPRTIDDVTSDTVVNNA